jgi:hypothetical protein
VSLENIKDSLDDIAKMEQSWNDRLSFKNLVSAKRNIESKLKPLLDWHHPIEVGGYKLRAILQGIHPVGGAGEEDREVCGREILLSYQPVPLTLHEGRQVDGVECGPYRYDGLVLIENIEVMKLHQRFIPTWVWFQLVKEFDSLGRGALYVFGKAGFKFLLGLPNDEVDMLEALPLGVAMANDGDRQEIKGRAGVVDRVANDRGPVAGQRFLDLYPIGALSRLRIIVGNDGVGISSKELIDLGREATDVGFGLFDL